MIVDLHTHSTASDGQYTPSQLVRLAAARGLEALALTDHDTLDGLEEAVESGRRAGLRVLRGVELGAKEYRSLHILGYGFTPGAPGLGALCARMREGRDERKYRILDFLREKGLGITLAEVEGSPAAPSLHGLILRRRWSEAATRQRSRRPSTATWIPTSTSGSNARSRTLGPV